MKKRERAAIIGGGIAGLLAARVLSEFFEEVILIEKDRETQTDTARKGVPQGSHGHALLKSGEEALEKLFPGIVDELIEDGAIPCDFAEDLSWQHHGWRKLRYRSGTTIIQQSRPFLERHIRQKVAMLPNVTLIEGSVRRMFVNASLSEVTGIEVHSENGNEEITAELVIDAGGAGTRTPAWLEELGLPSPDTSMIKVGLIYSSAIYRQLPENRDWASLLVYPNPPHRNRGGSISPIEHGRWMATLLSYGESHSPANEEEFLAFAQSLADPALYEALKSAELLSKVHTFRFPSLTRRHYERLRKIPNGLVIMGDAFCRFDPVFGQGMSVAAQEALALQRMLGRYRMGRLPEHFSRKIHKEFSALVSVPWLIALTEDFRFPGTSGRKPLGLGFLQWYVKKVVHACSTHRNVYDRFIQVLHLQAHPVTLFHPAVMSAMLKIRKG